MTFQIDTESYTPPYQQLKNHIRKSIQHGQLAPGDRLPTMRAFREETGMALATVNKVIKDLTEEGLLTAKVGRGTFVSTDFEALPRTLNIAVITGSGLNISVETPYTFENLQGINQNAAENGHRIRVCSYDDESHLDSLDIDAYILMHAYRSMERALAPRSAPTLSIDEISPEFEGNVLCDDMEGGIRLGLQQLQDWNHRHMGLWVGSVGAKDSDHKRDLILSIAEEFDFDKIDVLTAPTEDDSQLMDAALRGVEEFKAMSKRPSVIFCITDDHAVRVMQACHQLGLHVPEDVSVMGLGGLGIFAHHYPRLTTVDLHTKQKGYDAVELLHDIVCGKVTGPVQRTLPVSIKTGESCVPLTGG
jgi:DNA-binding LacI/PurR family transcriptional regulator